MSILLKISFPFILLLICSPNAQANAMCTEKSLYETVDIFANAFVTADVDLLERLLTDNYIHVNGGSGNIIRKKAWLNWLLSRKVQLDTGKYKITHYKIDLQNVVMTGNTAVVVGKAESAGINKEEPFSSVLRFSNTWICSDLGWRRASFHDSMLN